MAIANVIRVSIIGAMPNGEVWSVNPVWQIGGVSTAEDVSAAGAQAMADAVVALTLGVQLRQTWAPSTTWTGARVEARRWDGTLAVQAEAVKATPVLGQGTVFHPFQTSVVTSLRTGLPGGSGRGRLYWPATGMNLISTTLRANATTLGLHLADVKTFLTSITGALNATLTNDAVLSVWSRTNAATTPVSSIQEGDVLDVQRRRRDALIEGYQALAFP